MNTRWRTLRVRAAELRPGDRLRATGRELRPGHVNVAVRRPRDVLARRFQYRSDTELRAMTRYRIDHAEVRAIAREWGAAYDELMIFRRRNTTDWNAMLLVEVRWQGDWTLGAEVSRLMRLYVAGDRDPRAVARTIAHELCHAVQATHELSGGDPWAWERRIQEEAHIPYWVRPIEVEAREWGDRYGDEIYRRAIKITNERNR